MTAVDQPSAAGAPSEVADDVDDAALARGDARRAAGRRCPGRTAVALLVIGYLAIYLLVFLPRGAVG